MYGRGAVKETRRRKRMFDPGSPARASLVSEGPRASRRSQRMGAIWRRKRIDGVSPHIDRFGPSLHVSPTRERALVLAILAT